jgi:hypothetical protein
MGGLQGATHMLTHLAPSSFIPKVSGWGKVPSGTRAGTFLSKKQTVDVNGGERPCSGHPDGETEAQKSDFSWVTLCE